MDCKKIPLKSGILNASRGRGGLPGVHGPPENVPDDEQLPIVYLLERIVFVRVIVAIKAAQPDSRRETIELLYAKLAAMVHGI